MFFPVILGIVMSVASLAVHARRVSGSRRLASTREPVAHGASAEATWHARRSFFERRFPVRDASSEEDVPARAPAFVALAAASVMSTLAMTVPLPAVAGGDSSVVSEFNASGIVFKDSVQVVSLEDPSWMASTST